jgi:predicted CopG family antitoxin
MGSRTVSLEDSAYARLRAAKRPGESFSVTINRVLEGSRPTFRALSGFLSRKDARLVRETIQRMRDEEAPGELDHLNEVKRTSGRHTRH